MKIKIGSQGWAGFTGFLGGVQFKDGVSVDHVAAMDQLRLSAIMTIEDAETGIQLGTNAAQPQSKHTSIPQATKLLEPENPETEFPQQINEPDYEVNPNVVKVPTPADLLDGVDALDPNDEIAVITHKGWNKELLEQLADEQGITGLRLVSDPLGVKGRGISELIKAIMDALDNPKVNN